MELTLIFLGTFISVVVQMFKDYYKLDPRQSVLLCLSLSLLFGVIYNTLVTIGAWNAVWQTFVSAGAFYAFIIKNSEKW